MRIPVSAPTTQAKRGSRAPMMSEVIDLPSGDASESAILSTILAQSAGELVECPMHAPMCESARLAVTRDRGLVLLAVSGQGLTDLRSIALAYRWMCENRGLIAMALPQFAI